MSFQNTKIFAVNRGKVHYYFLKIRDCLFQRILWLLLIPVTWALTYSNSLIPKKSSKLRISKEDKFYNRAQSKLRICIEHTFLKRFRLFSERYRARRKTFTKRFNLFHFQFKFLSFRICLLKIFFSCRNWLNKITLPLKDFSVSKKISSINYRECSHNWIYNHCEQNKPWIHNIQCSV